jgi:hypothetical protein
MATPDHERIVQVPAPVKPLRRGRSRLGEPTVRIELVVIDSNGQLGKELRPEQREGSQVTGGGDTCHRALTGMARSLSPNGRVDVPV